MEPEDASALAEAIIGAKATENKPRNGRAYVMEHASREICTKKYAEILRSVTKKD